MTQDQYKILFRHVFNFPDRLMCLKEWDRLYATAPFYTEGRKNIQIFFNTVLSTEAKRLEDKNQPTFPQY